MKLKERLLISIASTILTILVMFILDMSMLSKLRYKEVIPSHGRVKFASNDQPFNFKKRILHKSPNGSRELANVSKSGNNFVQKSVIGASVQGRVGRLGVTVNFQEDGNEIVDDFSDIVEYMKTNMRKTSLLSEFLLKGTRRKHNPTLAEVLEIEKKENLTNWDKFYYRISKYELYPEGDQTIEALLKDMATLPIKHISQKEGGTQLKLIIQYSENKSALFKPMRFPRDQQTLPNHFYFTDFERHNAEIAAFHLDRLLGFRRAPPVVGRVLNMTTELYKLAEGPLLKTFFISPANNLCFHGKCSYYCDTAHAICGNPDTLEGSFSAFLPPKSMAARKVWRHPWRRSYHKRKKAEWETDKHYCKKIKETPPYTEGRRLLDLMDMAVLDFLMGNMDRHHYETFKIFGNDTFLIHLDHGRGFGRADHDELSILAPIYQCCLIRQSTVMRLVHFHNNPTKLSAQMRDSMSRDPIAPVLWEPHLTTLDRHVKIILHLIRDCLKKNQSSEEVIYNDMT